MDPATAVMDLKSSTVLTGCRNMVIDRLSTAVNALSAPIPATSVSPSTWSSAMCSDTPISGRSAPNPLALTHPSRQKPRKYYTRRQESIHSASEQLVTFDAFYLVARCVKVVVLQITMYLTHKGSLRAFAFLEQLKPVLQALGDKRQELSAWHISFDHRLVVPNPFEDQGDLAFTWSLPGKFPDSIPGPVSIQFLSSKIRPLIAQEDASYLAEEV